MATITIENATFSYPDGTQAIAEATASIPAGSSVALLGANGAGKSTLARLISGAFCPQSGRILIDSWDSATTPASLIATKVGYVFPNPKLQIFSASVREEVSFGPRNLGWSSAEVASAVQEALQLTGLEKHSSAHPYELTSSERQRLALASILAMKGEVVILDEPTASLDGPSRRILDGVMEMLRSRGTTVIAISHDMDFVADNSQRAIVVQSGRLVADAPIAEVLGQAQRYGLAEPCPARLSRALHMPLALNSASFLEGLKMRGNSI